MNDPIAKWHEEHVNFGRLLDLLEQQLDQFHTGEIPNYELMLDVMYYMTHFPDLLHHQREDLAFEKIKVREPAVVAVIDDLMRQHDLLRRDGTALVENLDDIINGSICSRESVEGAGRAYLECFRGHMSVEEQAVFPAARRVLSAKDWDEITAAIEHLEDPLFGGAVTQRYAALHDQISREASTQG